MKQGHKSYGFVPLKSYLMTQCHPNSTIILQYFLLLSIEFSIQFAIQFAIHFSILQNTQYQLPKRHMANKSIQEPIHKSIHKSIQVQSTKLRIHVRIVSG